MVTEQEARLAVVGSYLDQLASALTGLSRMGVPVELRFGSILTDVGYVLQNEDGTWRARPKVGPEPDWWDLADRADPDDT